MQRVRHDRPLFPRGAFSVPIRTRARVAIADKKNKPSAQSLSVFGLLRRGAAVPKQSPDMPGCSAEASTQGAESIFMEGIGDIAAYVEMAKRTAACGQIKAGNPWVLPDDPFQAALATNAERNTAGQRSLDAEEALNLVLRPSIFVWAPEKIFPGACVT